MMVSLTLTTTASSKALSLILLLSTALLHLAWATHRPRYDDQHYRTSPTHNRYRYHIPVNNDVTNQQDSYTPSLSTRRVLPFISLYDGLRGGSQEPQQEAVLEEKDDVSLDEKVKKAMLKLGLTPPDEEEDKNDNGSTISNNINNEECSDGVCEMPSGEKTAATESPSEQQKMKDIDTIKEADNIASRLCAEFGVDESLAMAAIGATRRTVGDSSYEYDEESARALLQQEMDRIEQVSESNEAVQTLMKEGYDSFLCRRALAFADMDIDDARAILVADQMDRDEDELHEQQAASLNQEGNEPEALSNNKPESFKTVKVDANFDPTAIKEQPTMPAPTASQGTGAPKPANKADVVFEVTAAQIQEIVLESPVPVLLDVYADWCGPCKVLGPALEEMAVKAGGVFRLVKVNSDNERAVSSSLAVTALPTVFGLRDGKILNMFQGMPKSEKAMQSFMMGLLVGESNFDPAVTEDQKQQFHELTMKLVKMAGAACFSFSSRERLQDRVSLRLDELSQQTGDFVDAEKSTQIIRSLLSNVVRDPFEPKFRTINLKNKAIAANVAAYPAGLAILKSVGFQPTGEDSESLALHKKVVNVAPLLVARDCIDKWVDKTRHDVEKAARKRKDEDGRAKLQKEMEERGEVADDDEEEEEVVQDPNACNLKLRVEGKNKVHEISLGADEPLSNVLNHLPVSVKEGEEVQITCVARRLVVKASDKTKMSKSLRELRLAPAASLVVAFVGSSSFVGGKKEGSGGSQSSSSSALKQRATKKKRKKGSHTMQSVGIYAKDDNNKAELIDGGGGTWYEHDVSDDEDEAEKDEAASEDKGDAVDEPREVEEDDEEEQ